MKFVIYFDTHGLFRWRLYTASNRIIAQAAEGYSARDQCMSAILQVRQASAAEVEDETFIASQ